MILGMSLSTFVFVHVIISLIGIAAGFIVMFGMLGSNRMPGLTALFLLLTILTSATGFPLAPFGFDPPRAVGILSLILLAVAVGAYYLFHLAGAWRWIYVVSAIISLWFNVFVLIVQSFMKISALKALAPTQSEPPFKIAQGAALVLFVVLAIVAVRKFRPVEA